MSSRKTLGTGLIIGGAVWLVGGTAFFLIGHVVGEVDLAATIMGSLVFALPIGGGLAIVGAVLRSRALKDEAETADVELEGRVLSMIETAGSTTVPEMAAELGASTQMVREALYDLVTKKLFTGYVNWDAQRVYSVAAGEMPTDHCPNCGAKLELGGKDTVVCPYCKNEIFLRR